MQIGHVSRSTGRSAVQSVAYITGKKFVENRRNIIADYRNVVGRISKDGKGVFWETLAPEGSGICKLLRKGRAAIKASQARNSRCHFLYFTHGVPMAVFTS